MVKRQSLLKRAYSRSDIEAYGLMCRDDPSSLPAPKSHLEKKRKKVTFRELPTPITKKMPITQITPHKCVEYLSYFRSMKSFSGYYERNFSLQFERRPVPAFMNFQTGINMTEMKMIIEWIFNVGHRLSLSCEHVMAGVCLFQRCLGERQFKRREAHKAAIVCLILSSKMDELRDKTEMNIYVLYITAVDSHGFTTDELLAAEADILALLQFELVQPTCITFVITFLEELGDTKKEAHTLCCFIAQLFATDYNSHKYLPSTIAETVVTIALKTLRLECDEGAFFQVFRLLCPDVVSCLSDIKNCVLTKELRRGCDSLCDQYGDALDVTLDFEIEM